MSHEKKHGPEFEFQMRDRVAVAISNEEGTVNARAEYENDENYFRVRYVDGRGCSQLRWFRASELRKA